jgi:predicted Na+-dependent transporter
VLIYASLSGTSGGADLIPALAASAAFLAVSAVPALAWARAVSPEQRPAVAFAVGLRDFAVAATLATQAFGPPAATVAGIYGVLMLISGALATAALRRRARATTTFQ